MNPKPIKRNENLVPVSREHHATLLFCWKIRQGVKAGIDGERISRYIKWFWHSHLEPHFATEEKLLFVDHEDALVQRGLEDHRRIIGKINEINARADENKPKAFLELADLVDGHTRFEERELFPWLERKFSQLALEEIGAELQKGEHSAAEDYEDEFWSKEKLN